MTHIIEEINGCLEHQYYFAALSLALTLPNTCASYEKKAKANGIEYADWCNLYVKDELEIDGAIVYALRCGMFHALSADFTEEKAYKNYLKSQQDHGETRQQSFRFYFPHSDASEPVIDYEELDGEIKRMPCISHMICALIRGYEQFVQDNQEFSHDFKNLYFEG